MPLSLEVEKGGGGNQALVVMVNIRFFRDGEKRRGAVCHPRREYLTTCFASVWTLVTSQTYPVVSVELPVASPATHLNNANDSTSFSESCCVIYTLLVSWVR